MNTEFCHCGQPNDMEATDHCSFCQCEFHESTCDQRIAGQVSTDNPEYARENFDQEKIHIDGCGCCDCTGGRFNYAPTFMAIPQDDDAVDEALRDAGLPVKRCGLNSDWCVSAWHLSEGTPNVFSGHLYLVDEEKDGVETFMLVRPIYHDGGTTEFINVTPHAVALDVAIRIAKKEVSR